MPLKFYEDLNAFKLFLLDVGLLGALSEMEPAQMLISNKAMTESKGAFTENYVLTQLLCQQDIYTYYYSREDARLEDRLPCPAPRGDNSDRGKSGREPAFQVTSRLL